MIDFEARALSLFAYQYENNKLYQDYCNAFGKTIATVKELIDIPFLPISFFKTQEIKTGKFNPEKTFLSSTTSSDMPSQHLVQSLLDYEKNTLQIFNFFYKDVTPFAYLFLLPSYLEREGSSLIYMAKFFMQQSKYKNDSGFYLNDFKALAEQLKKNVDKKTPTILLGVSFALLDFAMTFPMNLENIIVMETGGMKGRKKEMIRKDLHTILKQQFSLQQIHSEYGMTELFSQAYSLNDGIFYASPEHMKILIRPIDNPLACMEKGKGAINIIDLANKHSCCFIATDDIGEVFDDESFSINGRLEQANIRGCNQMSG